MATKLTSGPVASADPQASEAKADVALSFEGISVEFTHSSGLVNHVLSDVSLHVKRGEFCVIVGASGCGKSTLLNLAAGLVSPTAGQIFHEGAAVTGVNTKVGYATQDANLIPWMTVRENLTTPLKVRKWPKADRAENVERWIEAVGLRGYGDHYPHQLSGGMQKRCAIARTLVYDPEIILMDEPFGALDAMTKVVMQDELLRLWQESRKTVLFITHDLTEAIALADRVVAMGKNPGGIREILDVQLERPRDVYRLMDHKEATDLHDRLWELMRDQISEGAN